MPKTSALTSATLPLTGNELVAVVATPNAVNNPKKATTRDIADLATTGSATSFVIFGDSLAQLVTANGATNDWFTWAQRMTGFPAQVIYNAGIGGNTTTQMLARVNADVIAHDPDWAFVMGGLNDVGATSATAATIISNLQAIYTACNNAGIQVIAGTITPSQFIAASATKMAVMSKVNQWIKAYPLTHPGVVVVDWHAALVDYTTSSILGAYSSDGVHPNADGCLRMGRVLAPVLADVLPHLDRLNSDPRSFPGANLIENGLFVGGSTLATGWAQGSYGTTEVIVCSKVPRNDFLTGSWQQIEYTSGNAQIYIENVNTGGADWAIGDQVYCSCEVEVDTPWTTLTYLAAVVQVWPANVAITADPIIGGTGVALPVTDLPRVMEFRSAPAVIPTGAVHLQFLLRITATGPGVVRVGRAEIRKV